MTGFEFLALQIVEMIVHMDCPGCETKIKKALSKLKGIFTETHDACTIHGTEFGVVPTLHMIFKKGLSNHMHGHQ